MADQFLWSVGVSLILLGFVLSLVAVLWLVFSGAKGKGKVKAAGAIIIGPIPIILGTDKES